jgi:SAM-dependent methyltransferase
MDRTRIDDREDVTMSTPPLVSHQETPLDRQALQHEIAAYRASASTLYTWSAGAQALALLRAALASGVLDAVRTPHTPAQVATATGLPHERVAAMLIALDAHGVVERAGDAYTLTADATRLVSPRAIQSLANILELEGVKAWAIERVGTAMAPYTTLSADKQLAMARGVMGLPVSPLWQATMAALMAGALPEVQAQCEAGGRYLELGCGAASGMLTMLPLFPHMTAVGVDLNAAVLDEARRRAVEVGVADRVELRRQDALEVREEASYDLVFWSAHFFPVETWAATLAVAYRALTPGGYLFLSYPGDPPEAGEALRQPAGRTDALSRLLFSGWGLPVTGTAALTATLEEAGFTIVRVVPNATDPLAGVLLARRQPM